MSFQAAADAIESDCASGLAPCLVIVADTDLQWAEQSVLQLRQRLDQAQVTFVTLSDRQHFVGSSVIDQSGGDQLLVDGHLVSPIHRSVLGSLVHSAAVRQFCNRLPTAV
ncbi:MAG: hypothetical protein HC805_06595 [Alkalinema sp. RL_2_19]|nr:hypothetical protein [Alkalinema sp. RL_2_19]